MVWMKVQELRTDAATSPRCAALGHPFISLTGPSSQMIAAIAAMAATIPRTTSIDWSSSSGAASARASRLLVPHHQGDQDEESPGAGVPGDEQARRFPKFVRDDEIGHDHQRRPDDQARMMGPAGEDAAPGPFSLVRVRRFGHGEDARVQTAPALPDAARRVKL